MRRIAVLIEKTGHSPVIHDNLVSLVWHLLAAGDKEKAGELHRDQSDFRPFVWAAEEWPDAKGYTLTFSSLKKEITQLFAQGAEKIQSAGEALLIEGNLYLPTRCIPVRDLYYIGKNVTLRAVSPVVITQRNAQGKKEYCFYPANPETWLSQFKSNLARRAAAWHGKEVGPIHVEILNPGTHAVTQYKGQPVRGRYLEVKITGSPEVLETAIYGGLGKRTGSGFGFALPA